jgi:hypothetical protein
MSGTEPNLNTKSQLKSTLTKPLTKPKPVVDRSRVTKTTLRYNLRSALVARAENGTETNMYSTLECGLELDIEVAAGESAAVRDLVKTSFADLGEVLRTMIKKEATKMGLAAVVIPDATPTVTTKGEDICFEE